MSRCGCWKVCCRWWIYQLFWEILKVLHCCLADDPPSAVWLGESKVGLLIEFLRSISPELIIIKASPFSLVTVNGWSVVAFNSLVFSTSSVFAFMMRVLSSLDVFSAAGITSPVVSLGWSRHSHAVFDANFSSWVGTYFWIRISLKVERNRARKKLSTKMYARDCNNSLCCLFNGCKYKIRLKVLIGSVRFEF